MSSDSSLRIFCSYRTTDRPRVEAVAKRLRDAGLEVFLDAWSERELEVGVVGKLEEGLESAAVGILFLSRETPDLGDEEGKWFQGEVEYFTHHAIERQKRVVVFRLDEDVTVPPFLVNRATFTEAGVPELIDLLLRSYEPGGAGLDVATGQAAPRAEVRVRLRVVESKEGSRVLHVQAHRGGASVGEEQPGAVGADFQPSLREFFNSTRPGARGPQEEAARSMETALQRLGEALGRAVLPGEIEAAVSDALAKMAAVGGELDVVFESEDAHVLSFPFEAARLADGRVLALQPGTRVTRQLLGVEPPSAGRVSPAGPLKILVAVGAPDEGQTPNVVLDPERELQTILDALQISGATARNVRILEVGSLAEIGRALAKDRYHVLHVSGHGGAGMLELETEDGAAEEVTSDALADTIQESGNPIPLVFLAACHGGRVAPETTSLAEGLLRRGVPQVVSMQSSVTDRYATELAGEFYGALAEARGPSAARALAHARRVVEQRRQKENASAPADERRAPEYATPSLFQGGPERPLIDGLGKLDPLPPRKKLVRVGAVPMLAIGDLVDRRVEVRETVRALRGAGRLAGVQLTGIGGIGKSSIAGRAMSRLAGDGWWVASYSGTWTLGELAEGLGASFLFTDGASGELREIAERLASGPPDQVSLEGLRSLLTNHRVLLVLDDFERQLAEHGARYADPTTEAMMEQLLVAASSGQGKLLVTSRYPVPGAEHYLERVAVPPLSPPQTRKLLWRLEALVGRASEDLRTVMRVIGGHPRMLEFLDAILSAGSARIPDVARRIAEQAEKHSLDLAPESFEGALETALAVGAGDILLDELLELVARDAETLALLHQLAVFSGAISPADLARALGDEGPEVDPTPEAERTVRGRLEGLADHSLVSVDSAGRAFVHRWTAELLRDRSANGHRGEARRAAEFFRWRLGSSHALEDGIEAARLFLAAEVYEEADGLVWSVLGFLRGRGQVVGLAQLANEFHSALPDEQFSKPGLMREEADGLGALGLGSRALPLQRSALALCEERVRQEPERADFLRDLSVSYERLGDLMGALGKGEEARRYFEQALEIAERLVRQEPERADFLRDLSVSYNKLGGLMGALGKGEEARRYFEQRLEIAERLVRQEPERADFLRDLSVSYNKLGDLMRALGKGEEARRYFEQALEIRERLVRQEPERADFLRDLSISYERLGDLMRALGKGEEARRYFEQRLEIAERLVRQEPERADFLRDLSISYERLGDLMRALGKGEEARRYFEQRLEIAERLVRQEPERADFLRDLSISYNKLGGLMRALGKGEEARRYFEQRLEIAERLVRQEPAVVERQLDVVVSLTRMADPASLARALAILRGLDQRGVLPPANRAWIEILEKQVGGEPEGE